MASPTKYASTVACTTTSRFGVKKDGLGCMELVEQPRGRQGCILQQGWAAAGEGGELCSPLEVPCSDLFHAQGQSSVPALGQ